MLRGILKAPVAELLGAGAELDEHRVREREARDLPMHRAEIVAGVGELTSALSSREPVPDLVRKFSGLVEVESGVEQGTRRYLVIQGAAVELAFLPDEGRQPLRRSLRRIVGEGRAGRPGDHDEDSGDDRHPENGHRRPQSPTTPYQRLVGTHPHCATDRGIRRVSGDPHRGRTR